MCPRLSLFPQPNTLTGMQGIFHKKGIAKFSKLFYNVSSFETHIENTTKQKEVKAMLFQPKEKGQGLVEYALILVLVAVVVIVVLIILGPAIGNVFSNIIANL